MSTVFEWQVARNGEGVSPTIGGAVVLPDFRGKGLASTLLEKRLEVLEEEHLADYAVVFTNERSRGYVERAGLRPLQQDEQLSQKAFELCDECTHCPIEGLKPTEDATVCCDYEGIRVMKV